MMATDFTRRLLFLLALVPVPAAAAGVRVPAPRPKIVPRGPGPISELRIKVGSERVMAGAQVPVSVQVRDAAGNAMDGDVQIESDVGELTQAEHVEVGRYRVTLTVPSVLSKNRSIFLLARARGGTITTSTTLTLVPGPVTSVTVDGPDALSADGSTRAQFTVTMVDAFGNPAEGVPKVEAEHGQLSTPVSEWSGYWVVNYESPRLLRDTNEVIQAEASQVIATHAMKLVAPSMLFAVALKGGLAIRTERIGGVLGAEVAAWARVGSQQLGLMLEGGWWNEGSSGSIQRSGTAIGFSGERDYLSLTGSAAWRLPVGSRSMFWLSLGGGAARVSSTARITGQPTVFETGWAPVVTAAVSGGLRVWRGYAFAELRAAWVGDAHLATLSGTTLPVFLQLGYRFDGW